MLVVLGFENEVLSVAIAEKLVQLSSFHENPVHFCEVVWLVVLSHLFIVLPLVVGDDSPAIPQIDEEEGIVHHHQGADAGSVGVDFVGRNLLAQDLVVEVSVDLDELRNDELIEREMLEYLLVEMLFDVVAAVHSPVAVDD